jgi:cobalt-zinc-cadmium efflux system membrane fusion protein
VQPDTELFRVADPEHLQIEAPVTAADATHIAAGDPAVVISGSRGRMDATVRSVTAALDDQTRAATVVLTLSSTAGQKLPAPGEFVHVVITPRTSAPTGIVLSSAAVQRVEGRDIVFVRTADGFRIQPVLVASRSAGRALITSGLKAGERVAAQNAFFLKAELGKGAEGDDE